METKPEKAIGAKKEEKICGYCHEPIADRGDLLYDDDAVPYHTECHSKAAGKEFVKLMDKSRKKQIPADCEIDAILNQEEIRKRIKDNPDLEDLSSEYGVSPEVIEDLVADKLGPYPEVAIVTVNLALPPKFAEILKRFLTFTGNTLANFCRSELFCSMQSLYQDIIGYTNHYPGLVDDFEYLDSLLQNPIPADEDFPVQIPLDLVNAIKRRFMDPNPGLYKDIDDCLLQQIRMAIQEELQVADKPEPK